MPSDCYSDVVCTSVILKNGTASWQQIKFGLTSSRSSKKRINEDSTRQNAFAVLEKSVDDEEEDVATVIMQMAALTTQSQLTAASAAATSSSVAAAIQQLNTNQQVMMQQMMAYANTSTMRNPPVVHNPPIRISTFQPLDPSSQVEMHR
jgi:hypothetical protein